MNATELFGDQQHAEFPVCTQLTLNHGICDSRCVSCPVGRVRFGDADSAAKSELAPSRRVEMSLALFRKVADEVAGHPHAWLRLHARGEPLLHPQLISMIAYAKVVGVSVVQAFTDAITLDERKARAILDAGLDVLECSIHGHTNTYERLMRNGHFQRVKDNVIGFRQLRDESGASTRLVVSAVDQPGFQEEKEAHRSFWSEHADEVIYRPYHSWGNRIDATCSATPRERHACAQLWTRCTIGPTGKILACFNSWDERDQEVLGDLNDRGTTIAAVWQSRKMAALRQDHAEGNYSLPCCKGCSDWTGSSWGKNSYENLIHERLNLDD